MIIERSVPGGFRICGRAALFSVLFAVAVSASIVASAGSSFHHPEAQMRQESLTVEQARKLKNPISATKDSVTRGRTLFSRNCTECHGSDARATVDVVANATDLTEPKFWRSGTTDGEVFRSIREGAGDGMPPFKSQIDNPEDVWHLVNFIQSLWPRKTVTSDK